MTSRKERDAFLKILEAFPDMTVEEIKRLIRDALRGMYNK